MKIKDLKEEDRPIERMINNGINSLSNEELMSIVIKTGTKEESAKSLAEKILSQIDNINDIRINNLTNIKGIKTKKAATILAALELGKRLNNKKKLVRVQFSNPSVIYDYYKKILSGINQEHFYVVYLDTKNKVIEDKLIFIGTINASIVHPREVFRESYLLSATSIICVHNHPSGNPMPSNEDVKITNVLVETGKILGIKVLDHIIIGENNYYSFHENKDIM